MIIFVDVNNEKLKAQALETLNRYMATHGLRRTAERYAVLDYVTGITGHFVIEDMLGAMQQGAMRVSRATVYNTIDLLVDAGILRRMTFAGSRAQYEVVQVGHANHLHLVCTMCGRVREVNDMSIERQLKARRYETFHPEYFALSIYGVCSRCQRRQRRTARK